MSGVQELGLGVWGLKFGIWGLALGIRDVNLVFEVCYLGSVVWNLKLGSRIQDL